MDSLPTGAFFVILALLILASAFFSASETALMRLSRYRLRHLARHGHRGARLAEKLLERPDRLLGVILLGNNALNLYASFVATLLALRLGGDRAAAIATGILTFAILVFAEVAPKTLAVLKAEPVAFGASYIFVVLLQVLYPIVWVLNLCANGLLRLFGLHPDRPEEAGITRDELRTLVLESGNLLARRQQLLLGVLELEEASVEDVMVPRSRIEGIDISEEWPLVLRRLGASRHTHLPLYNERIEDTVGMLHVRDAVHALTSGELNPERLRALAREPYFVPEGTSLARQLVNFRRLNQRCGLVVDEYGDILGLLTLEDVLREVAGELGGSGKDNLGDIVRESGGSLLIPGYLAVRTVNRRLGWHLPTRGPRTINGLVLEQLETIPAPGTRLTIGGHRAEIVESSASGVGLVRFSQRPHDEPPAARE